MAKGPSPRGEAGRRGRDSDAPSPWLDEAEPDARGGSTLIGRSTIWMILLGLLLLVSVVAAGVFMVARQDTGAIDALPPGSDIPLLRDPGPWKVPPEGPGVDGIPVEGRDRVLFGTGVGDDPEARIALDALPEEPLERPEPAPVPREASPTDLLPDSMREEAPDTGVAQAQPARPPTPSSRPDPAAMPGADAPRPVEKAALVAPSTDRPATAAAGSIVQLGAFSSEARARAAWKSLSERFSYLGGLSPVILPVSSDGKTLYRLRTDAGTPASARDICGRLKVAGESCAAVGG